MADLPSLQSLPGSRIQWREADSQLVLCLPGQPRRFLKDFGRLTFFLVVFLILVFYISEGWLPALIPLGFVAVIILVIAFAVLAARDFKKTVVRLTLDKVVLESRFCGMTTVEPYTLSDQSRARLWYPPASDDGAGEPPQGIQLDTQEAAAETKESQARFGEGLSLGEMHWVEWRINRFLGRASDANAPAGSIMKQGVPLPPIEGLPEQPLTPPKDTKVRIEEGLFESRIDFPNTFETGSYNGIGIALFGLVWSGVFLYFLAHNIDQPWPRHGAGPWFGTAVTVFFMLLCGLGFLLAGLTRLFGRKSLTISPEKITYRATLLGVGPWTSVRTGDVISLGGIKKARDRSGRITGPAKGLVIRTATTEIRYGEQFHDAVRGDAEAAWLAGEIARRIFFARCGRWPSVGRGQPASTRRPADTTSNKPLVCVPYRIDRRPMPAGEFLETLLPLQVGPFRRASIEDPRIVGNKSIDCQYRCSSGEVFGFRGEILFTIGMYEEPDVARDVVAVAQAEVTASEEHRDDQFSLGTEPSFFRSASTRGAFMAWTRGTYYFSASVRRKNANEALDRFMEAFTY